MGWASNQASPPLSLTCLIKVSYSLPSTTVHVTGDQEENKISPCFAFLPHKSLSRRVWLSLGVCSHGLWRAQSRSWQGCARLGIDHMPLSDDIRDGHHWKIYAP
ncbi:hypothetical protein LZ30DRAFT_382927 [Colletotrichum cereale]|nr:hypothetical protein LZ30DRAFT_382927 [Colletotrichum cereale]